MNNPLKYIDPSGHDVVIVGGNNNSKEAAAEEMARWIDSYIAAGIIDTYKDTIYPVYDTDPSITALGKLHLGADVEPRIEQLQEFMGNDPDILTYSGKLTDIKIFGHSEGAATVGAFFARGLASESVINELSAVFLFDCPTGKNPSSFVSNFDYEELFGLPDKMNRLTGREIITADIYNSASWVHWSDLRGWERNTYNVNYYQRNIFNAHSLVPEDAISVVRDLLGK